MEVCGFTSDIYDTSATSKILKLHKYTPEQSDIFDNNRCMRRHYPNVAVEIFVRNNREQVIVVAFKHSLVDLPHNISNFKSITKSKSAEKIYNFAITQLHIPINIIQKVKHIKGIFEGIISRKLFG